MPLLISISGSDLPDENEGTVGLRFFSPTLGMENDEIYEGSGGIVGMFFSDLDPSRLTAEKGKPFRAELL